MSTGNIKILMFLEVKCGRCAGLTVLSSSMSRMSRQFGILNISQSCSTPRPVNGDSFSVHYFSFLNMHRPLDFRIILLWQKLKKSEENFESWTTTNYFSCMCCKIITIEYIFITPLQAKVSEGYFFHQRFISVPSCSSVSETKTIILT
jgi:hypothetical protein